MTGMTMHGRGARGAAAYYETHVTSRSPLELVVLLYDGATRYLGHAADAIRHGDLVAKRDGMSRGVAIVNELHNTLDMEAGGEVAHRLDELYAYILGRLVEANLTNDAGRVDEAVRLLGILREGWAEIVSRSSAAA